MDPVQHLEFLRARRSRRHFTNAPVSEDALERIIEAGVAAPSGANSQPWQFIAIAPGHHRKAIEDMCRVADDRFHETAPDWLKEWMRHHNVSTEKIYFAKAPWLLAVFSQRDLPYWLPSVWLCIANVVNQVEAEGLHTVVYTPTLGKLFNELIGVDPNWSFQALLPIGLADPDEVVRPRPRESARAKTYLLDEHGLMDWVKEA